MTDLLHDVDAPSDAELISRVRGGDVAAYGELFSRHVDAAKRLSRQLVRGPDADDLVSEAFAKVLTVLQGGGGPDVAFRAYLLTSVRRLHVDRIRAGSRLQTSDDMEEFDPGVPFQDTAVAAFESGAAAKAFASLPERWQLVLWHLEVEGQKPAEVAPLLGMSPNSVSALAYRAREGLRQAFLTMHLNDISETDCRWVNEHLGAYVRNGLAKRESTKVQAHLDECRRCTAMYLELTEVNSNLRAILGPLLLGAAATGYLASSGTAAGGLGLSAMFGRVRDTVSANAGAATVGAIAAGVAAVATAGIVLLPSSGPDTVTGADEPIGTVSTPGAPGGTTKPGDKKGDEASPSDEASTTEAASPAAVLPSGLPGPSELPVAQVADGGTDQGTGADQGGSTDQGGPGGDGTTSPSDPSTEPSPTEPSPTEPSPTEPSPTEPSPTEPSPTEPSPTEPSPTEPSPTEPSPTEPAPTEPPAVISSDVVFASQPTFDGTAVIFTIQGSPELPPAINVALSTDPTNPGIVFGTGGDCPPNVGNPTQATCLTANPLVARPFMRASTTAAGGQFTAMIPLDIPASAPDTRVTLTLSVPAGYDDPQPGDNSTSFDYDAPEAPPTADVALDLPSTVGPDRDGTYSLDGTVRGIPSGYTGTASFELSGKAQLTGSSTPGCTTTDGSTLTCTSLSDGNVEFHLAAQDNTTSTDVAITVAELEGYTDPARDNNSDGSTLTPVSQDESADVALDLPDSAEPGQAGDYSLAGKVSGIPAAYTGTTVFTLSGEAAFAGSGTSGCAKNDDTTLTCAGLTDGEIHFDLAADDNTGDTPVTIQVAPLEGHPDPKPENNSDTSTLKAVQDQVGDLHYSAGPTAVLQGDNHYLVSARVAGIPLGTKLVTFRFPEPQQEFELPLLTSCTIVDKRTMTCPPPQQATELTVLFVAKLPAGRGSLTVEVGGQSVSQPIGRGQAELAAAVP
jgi:RNA polymerase sigma factor (sigma-70 family)